MLLQTQINMHKYICDYPTLYVVQVGQLVCAASCTPVILCWNRKTNTLITVSTCSSNKNFPCITFMYHNIAACPREHCNHYQLFMAVCNLLSMQFNNINLQIYHQSQIRKH